MTFVYPGNPNSNTHKSIVKKLLKGEFLHAGTAEYETLYENKRYYESFFQETFDIQLEYYQEIFYCATDTKGSSYTKEILTAVAIMMYEINKMGNNPIEVLRSEEFTREKINNLVSNSVQFSRYAREIDKRFISRLADFGIIKRFDSERFLFTDAIDIFIKEFESLREQVQELE